MERLSTGLRINHATDDPAGLAMATTMSAKLRSGNQALRNINDGISVTSIAEGAMQETGNLLIRMRELTIQSMTGTLSTNDRNDVQTELTSLQSQIDAIAKGTQFNGLNLLDKSAQYIAVQTGTDPTDTVDIKLKGTRVQDLGSGVTTTFSGGTHATASLTGSTDGKVSISGELLNPVSDGGSTSFANGSARALAESINLLNVRNLAATSLSGSISLGAVYPKTITTSSVNPITGAISSVTTTPPVNIQPGDFVINGHDISFSWDATMGTSLSSAVLDAINNSNSGVTASDNGGIVLQSSNPDSGYNIQVQSGGASSQSLFSAFNLKQRQDQTVIGSINVSSERALEVVGGLNGTDQGWSITPGIYGSLKSLESIDIALNQISEYRGGVGATQNRLESEARNLQNQQENLSAAQSRIMDADVAQETADLTKNSILKQAGIAILAQANQMPNMALSLLRQM